MPLNGGALGALRVEFCVEGEHTPVRVAYRQIRPATVVYARSTGSYADAGKEAWARLNAWLSQNYTRRRIKRGFGIFHDNPQTTATDLLRYDACVELMIAPEMDPADGIGRQTLAGGTYAVHTHVGAYAPLGGLLSEMHRDQVPKQGLAVDYDRAFMAIYLNDPLMTREVHRRTELCIPVLPLKALQTGEDTVWEDDFAAPAIRRAVGGLG